MQVEGKGMEEGYETHRSDGLMADGCSCCHSLEFMAVFSLSFFS